eukprot:3159880-Pyramimonas_sp.AAC.1
MQHAKPEIDLSPRGTLDFVPSRGEVVVRLFFGGTAVVPTKLQWSRAAVYPGFDGSHPAGNPVRVRVQLRRRALCCAVASATTQALGSSRPRRRASTSLPGALELYLVIQTSVAL